MEAEVAAYLAAHLAELDERGRRLVVRNGHARLPQVLTNAGAVEVVAPRVNDKRVDGRFLAQNSAAHTLAPGSARIGGGKLGFFEVARRKQPQ
ncbi:hypothetical protein ML5_6001 [Micromonospora sp. L5]|nr:hypothetical protein ML5_6001 [Micromonospora sp. L5]